MMGTLRAIAVSDSRRRENMPSLANCLGLWLFQEAGVDWNMWSMLHQMGWVALGVVAVLFAMSAWSIGVMIDRWLTFAAARKQSRMFAPAVAGV
jgi:hypothetical protein